MLREIGEETIIILAADFAHQLKWGVSISEISKKLFGLRNT